MSKKYLAIINKETNIVENVIVPPSGAQAWFVPEGFIAVLTDTGNAWDIYDPETDTFTPPPQPTEPEA